MDQRRGRGGEYRKSRLDPIPTRKRKQATRFADASSACRALWSLRVYLRLAMINGDGGGRSRRWSPC